MYNNVASITGAIVLGGVILYVGYNYAEQREASEGERPVPERSERAEGAGERPPILADRSGVTAPRTRVAGPRTEGGLRGLPPAAALAPTDDPSPPEGTLRAQDAPMTGEGDPAPITPAPPIDRQPCLAAALPLPPAPSLSPAPTTEERPPPRATASRFEAATEGRPQATASAFEEAASVPRRGSDRMPPAPRLAASLR